MHAVKNTMRLATLSTLASSALLPIGHAQQAGAPAAAAPVPVQGMPMMQAWQKAHPAKP